jgi:hypothetical protein
MQTIQVYLSYIGAVAKWQGKGLQNPDQRSKSARRLFRIPFSQRKRDSIFSATMQAPAQSTRNQSRPKLNRRRQQPPPRSRGFHSMRESSLHSMEIIPSASAASACAWRAVLAKRSGECDALRWLEELGRASGLVCGLLAHGLKPTSVSAWQARRASQYRNCNAV